MGKALCSTFMFSLEMDVNNGKKENKWGLESLTSTFHRQYKCYLSTAKMCLVLLRNMVLACKGQKNIGTESLDISCEAIIRQCPFYPIQIN